MKKKQFSGLVLVCLALVALLYCANGAWGQDITAGVTGTVVDQSGAAVAGATVTVKDTERGTILTSVTNENGIYNFLHVSVGVYDLKVEAKGFQTAVHPPFTLILNQTARIDVKLQLGSVAQTVEVVGGAPILQTETTEVSTIIDSKTNDNLPLATRNPTQLTLLSPGAVSVDAHSFNLGSNTAEGGGRPYINGNREQANNFLLDGVDNNQISDNLLGYTPSPDAIQEFNLITQNASAEFGNYMGGIVNTSIKSGTNSFHGDVFEFFRNDVMNANQWENKINPNNQIATPKLRWNMFGGTVGGPILKNKLFFFTDYQGGRFDFPATTKTITVLSNAERQGNFSSLLGLSTPVQIVNPCAANTGINGGTACQLTAAKTAFAGNIIPTNMLNPIFTALVSSPLYPTAVTASPTGYAFANNTTNELRNSDQEDVKLDYNLSERDRFFGRYSQAKQDDPKSNSIALLGSNVNRAKIFAVASSWTHSFSPSLMNEFRFGENRVYFTNGATTFNSAVGQLGKTLGIADANPNNIAGLLGLTFGGGNISNTGTGTLSNIGSSLVLENFQSAAVQFDDGLIYTRGRHTTKVGFQLNRYRIDVFYSGNAGELGSIIFGNAYTGDAGGDFALGLPNYVGRGVSQGGWHQRDWLIAGYVQHDWRVANSLTLNLGVRYEARTPWVEENNRQDTVDITTGQVLLAGQNGNSRGLYNSVYGWPDIQPRLGFAWTPPGQGGKTVVRGAYSVSSYLEGTGTNLRLTQNPPFTPPQTEGGNNKVAGTTPFTIAAGSIAGSVANPANPYQGALLETWGNTVQPAIAQQVNFSVQREIVSGTTFQIGYVGQRSSHLMVPEWLTQGILQSGGTVAPSPYLGGPNSAGGFGPNGIGQAKLTASVGKMHYDALQAVLQRRFGHGLESQVSYTFSKCMTDNSGYYGTWSGTTQATPASPYWQNLYNPAAEWAQCYYDSKHIISAYALYELPVGRGKQFLKDAPTALNAVVGNWSVNPIVSWHTGFPFALYGPDNSGTGSQGARPDCNGNPIYIKKAGVDGLHWVSPITFSTALPGTFGNCPAQGPVIGPGYSVVDLSLHKNFKFTESMSLQFRAEALNLFNHANFAKMNANVSDDGKTHANSNAAFGVITQTQDARQLQLALKFYF